jgi:hypothetical protein
VVNDAEIEETEDFNESSQMKKAMETIRLKDDTIEKLESEIFKMKELQIQKSG